MLAIDDSIDSFVSYLKIERNVSGNTLSAYTADLSKLREYLLTREQIDPAKVKAADLMDEKLASSPPLASRRSGRGG